MAPAVALSATLLASSAALAAQTPLLWTRLPDLPDSSGFAGSLAGACGGSLLFAGGSNFPEPVWTSTKHYDAAIWTLAEASDNVSWTWHKHNLTLPRPMAYASCGSFGDKLACAGGQNMDGMFQDAFAITCNKSQLLLSHFSPMPVPTTMASSVVLGNDLWVIGGQTTANLTDATQDVWILDTNSGGWRQGPALPVSRVLSLAIVHNKYVYVMSGRRQDAGEDVEFLTDCWRLDTTHMVLEQEWKKCASMPACAMAGTIGVLNDQIFVLGGDDGSHFGQDDPSNPGYVKNAYSYDHIADAWTFAGKTTEGEVTTIAIPWDDGLVINGGEVKPRVRTNHTWFAKAVDFLVV